MFVSYGFKSKVYENLASIKITIDEEMIMSCHFNMITVCEGKNVQEKSKAVKMQPS